MTPQSILNWLRSIEKQNGYEILLVQTLRNALMGASVIASTSLVAIIGVVSIGRAFPGGNAELLRHGNWAINVSSVILAVALTESLLALRTLARAGFASGFSSGLGKSGGDELADAGNYSRYLASALRQLSRAAIALSLGMAVAVIGGIMFAW
jgi:hypothetical protein